MISLHLQHFWMDSQRRMRANLRLWLIAALVWGALALTACQQTPSHTTDEHTDEDMLSLPVQPSPVGNTMPTDTQQRFDGVAIHVLTNDTSAIVEPIKTYANTFAADTGATIKVVSVPSDEVYGELHTSFVSKTQEYDAAIVPAHWLMHSADRTNGEYVDAIADITTRVRADEALAWDDIARFVYTVGAAYDGRIYGIPLGGNTLMTYYRHDVMQEATLTAPDEWEEYIALARHMHGKDLNGDGEGDYGSCIALSQGSDMPRWMLWAIAGSVVQTHGTQDTGLFDTDTQTVDMPQKAFAATLDLLKTLALYGPPDATELDQHAMRSLFADGRCLLTIEQGDAGLLPMHSSQPHRPQEVGMAMLPGSRIVFDTTTGMLVECNAARCPHAVDDINHAPFVANGGWVGVINAAASVKSQDAAYAFLSFMSQPAQSDALVANAAHGFTPYRDSHFADSARWVQAGMGLRTARNYLEVLEASLQSPNAVPDVPMLDDSPDYTVLDTTLHAFLSGTLTRAEAMQRVYGIGDRK